MNYFFGINNEFFSSEILVPTFQNKKPKPNNISLFKCYAENNKWNIQELKNNYINNDFFLIKNDEISNNEVYFLAYQNDFIGYDYLKLKNFNNFTDTVPAYRANFKIYIKERGGFSSYQSDYPYSMIKRTGTILSSVSSIANKDADKIKEEICHLICTKQTQ